MMGHVELIVLVAVGLGPAVTVTVSYVWIIGATTRPQTERAVCNRAPSFCAVSLRKEQA